MFRKKQPLVLILVGLFLTVLAWVKVLYEIDRQPYFIDEISDTFASFNFFRHLDYTSHFFDGGQRFGPGLSVGLVSSWPGGLIWTLGGGLFESRLALGFVGWLEAVFLFSFFLFRVAKIPKAPAFAGATLGFLLLLQTPYWYGFCLNVGELTGALFLGAGILALTGRRWWLAGLLFGFAVWGAKFIYLPAVCAAMAVMAFRVLAHCRRPGAEGRRSVRKWLGMVACFFLPLVVWLLVIGFRYSARDAGVWLSQFGAFIIHGNSGLDGPPPAVGLISRLASPSLEWAGYDFSTKLRILVLVFFGTCSGFWAAFRFKTLMPAALGASLVFYAAWYFLWSPTMFIRHAQPMLYLGFGLMMGLLGLLVVRNARRRLLGFRVDWIFIVLFGLILLKEVRTSTARFPIFQPGDESYARNCRVALSRYPCVPKTEEVWLRKVEERSKNPIYTNPPFSKLSHGL